MKKVMFLISIVCFLLHSCSKDNKDEKITLTLSENNIEFTSLGGIQIITVTANIDWEVRFEADWLEVESNGSLENGSVMISVQRNFLRDERNATLFITSTSGTIVKEITIYQQGNTDSPLRVYYGDGIPVTETYDVEGKFLPPLDGDVLSFDNWSPDPIRVINGKIDEGIMDITFPENYCLDSTYERTSTGGIRIASIQLFLPGGRSFYDFALTKNDIIFGTKTSSNNIFRTIGIYYADSEFNNGSLTLHPGWNFVEYITDFNQNPTLREIGNTYQDINDLINEGYRWEKVIWIGPLI